MSRLIASFFYVGFLRPAPGTWGSLAALPVAWGLMTFAGPAAIAPATMIAVFLGLWASARVIAETGEDDPSWVVIDEVAGMWLALMPVAVGAARAGVPVEALWPGWVVAFLAFRLFDIWKPGPVGWADRRGDALGLMLDDLFAGVLAGIVVVIAAGLAHGLMAL